MAAGVTYNTIATTTLTSASADINFTSIPSTYTDLVLVIDGTSSGANINYGVRFNSDAASNYSSRRFYGDGSSKASDELFNMGNSIIANMDGTQSSVVINFMNYSSTNTYKTFLARSNSTGYVWVNVGLWRSTAAINAIQYVTTTGYQMQAGTTATLYGIAAA